MLKYLLMTVLFLPAISAADVPKHQQAEVEHLLTFIMQSQCEIVRNGIPHNAESAIKHIKAKYDYYRDDIKTTEDFIQYSATKSTLSGKYYLVTCEGSQPVKTQDWLLSELNKARNKIASQNVTNVKICKSPRPQMCTMEYVPVCAQLEGNMTKTYASGCNACSDKNVISYKADTCK
jgi:hypothetical protein